MCLHKPPSDCSLLMNRRVVVSSTIGSVASCDNDSPLQDNIGEIDDRDVYNNPDWEHLNETERTSNITNTLKQLGNIKKKIRAHSS